VILVLKAPSSTWRCCNSSVVVRSSLVLWQSTDTY